MESFAVRKYDLKLFLFPTLKIIAVSDWVTIKYGNQVGKRVTHKELFLFLTV
jgi:hypothetical protein